LLRPLHPYTRALISASVLTLPGEGGQEMQPIVLSGEMPSPPNPPPGCRFHTRCYNASARCRDTGPELRDVGSGHKVACFLD